MESTNIEKRVEESARGKTWTGLARSPCDVLRHFGEGCPIDLKVSSNTARRLNKMGKQFGLLDRTVFPHEEWSCFHYVHRMASRYIDPA